MTDLPRKVEINLAAIPVTGFGGMCMVIASLVCAIALPPTRWFMLAAIAAGVVFGVAMILCRSAFDIPGPADGEPPAAVDRVSSPRRRRGGPISLGRLRTAEV